MHLIQRLYPIMAIILKSFIKSRYCFGFFLLECDKNNGKVLCLSPRENTNIILKALSMNRLHLVTFPIIMC